MNNISYQNITNLSETERRLYTKLYNDLGSQIMNYLSDKNINEIMLNPNGSLWIDKSTTGQECVGAINKTQAFAILQSVAGVNNFVISEKNPLLEAQLPFFKELQGQRFTGQIPPLVNSPCFTLRKRTEKIFDLENYIATKRMTNHQANILRSLINENQNILVCGSPGSGKTSVTNALIIEAVKISPNERFIILEDTPEIQCNAHNKVSFLTSINVNMTTLLRASMRMRPDKIFIGEVRGAECLDMLKAWNTGCPGGICTIHANGCEEALQRVLDLAMEAGLNSPPISLVTHTINAIVSVNRLGNQKGFISEIIKIKGFNNEKFEFEKLA